MFYFELERRHIHDNIIPELQKYCNSLAIDLLVIDPHWRYELKQQGNSYQNQASAGHLDASNAIGHQRKSSTTTSSPMNLIIGHQANIDTINPHEFNLQLREIDDCSRQSLGIFFVVSTY